MTSDPGTPDTASPPATLTWRQRLQAWVLRVRRPLMVVAGVGTVLGGLAGYINVYRSVLTSPMAGPAAPPSPAPSAEAAEARRLAQQALAITRKMNYTREDLVNAADLARRATELQPGLALAWGARSRVEAMWILRNWEWEVPHHQAALDFAKRASALQPDETHALFGQALAMRRLGARPDALALLKRLLELDPGDAAARREYATQLSFAGQAQLSREQFEECLRRNPRDALAHYGLANNHAGFFRLMDRDLANVDVALKHLDQALAIEPAFVYALVQKAGLLAGWKGDIDGARAALAQMQALGFAELSDDRPVYMSMWVELLADAPDKALDAARRSTTAYFSDTSVAQASGWLVALAHRRAGRQHLANEAWRSAESHLRGRIAAQPDLLTWQADLAITLAWQGRGDEAARTFARFDAASRDSGRPVTTQHLRYAIGMGDTARAVEYIRVLRERIGIPVWDTALRRDPWFDPLRGKPAFETLLRELPPPGR